MLNFQGVVDFKGMPFLPGPSKVSHDENPHSSTSRRDESETSGEVYNLGKLYRSQQTIIYKYMI